MGGVHKSFLNGYFFRKKRGQLTLCRAHSHISTWLLNMILLSENLLMFLSDLFSESTSFPFHLLLFVYSRYILKRKSLICNSFIPHSILSFSTSHFCLHDFDLKWHTWTEYLSLQDMKKWKDVQNSKSKGKKRQSAQNRSDTKRRWGDGRRGEASKILTDWVIHM